MVHQTKIAWLACGLTLASFTTAGAHTIAVYDGNNYAAVGAAQPTPTTVSITSIPAISRVNAGSNDGSSATTTYDISDTGMSFGTHQLLSGAMFSSTSSAANINFTANVDLHYEVSGTFSTVGQLWTPSHIPTGGLTVSLSESSDPPQPLFSYHQPPNSGEAPFDFNFDTAGGSQSGTLRSGRNYLFSFSAHLQSTGPGAAASASGHVSFALGVPGDFNGDGNVGFDDLVVLARNYTADGPNVTYATGDVNQDNNVGFDDLLILARNYGRSLNTQTVAIPATVPEPAVATLFVPAAVLLLRRRRAHGSSGRRPKQ